MEEQAPQTEAAAAPDHLHATAQKLGLSMDDIKKGYQRLRPIIGPIVKLTPNKFDDALVLFLDTIFADPVGVAG